MMAMAASDADAVLHKMQVEVVEDCDAKKINWVNSYLRQIFGEEYCLSLSQLGLVKEEGAAVRTTIDEKETHGTLKDVDDKVAT